MLNIVAIIYQRIGSFSEIHRNRTGRIFAYISFIWVAAGLFSVPTGLMKLKRTVNNNKSIGNCESVDLLGKFEATLIYETLRLAIFHVGVGLYMLYGDSAIHTNKPFILLSF